ncbi:MAG: hypothetical protein C0467_24335 [Planctomycetaceae bacterium]|nr:hypothetical protein [Planctomycetaceae bacterium]
MDIVTHTLMGSIVASPFLKDDPAVAFCIIFGSMAPDLDVFTLHVSRRFFLKCHQTYTHALPLIALGGLLVAGSLYLAGVNAIWLVAAFAAGMAFHALLDATNTYGVTLLAPFTTRRFCTEWVFFIDSVVILATVTCLLLIGELVVEGEAVGPGVAVGYVAFLAAYWMLKGYLWYRAKRLSPRDTLSIIPSAAFPWRFLCCQPHEHGVRTFTLNALDGTISNEEIHPVFDAEFDAILKTFPEYRLFRQLSPAYHVVAVDRRSDATLLTVRDLRIRNFNIRFGQLDVRLAADGSVANVVFHT